MTSPWSPQSPEYEAWPEPQGAPMWPQAQPIVQRESYDVRRDFPRALAIALLVALAGIGAGFAWHATSARPRLIEEGGGLQLPAQDDKNYFGAESAFFVIAVGAGAVAGGLTFAAARRRGPAIPVGLAAGSIAAGLIMRAVGQRQVTNQTLARGCGTEKGLAGICEIYNGHLQLRAPGLTLVWAIAALAIFAVLSWLGGRGSPQSIGVHPVGGQPVGWPSAAWPPQP